MPVRPCTAALMSLALVVGTAGCGSQAQHEGQAAPASTATTLSQPTRAGAGATHTSESQAASKLVKEVMKEHGGTQERQSPAEKRAEKKLEEKVGREAVTVPNGPTIHEQKTAREREQEARRQAEAIEEYKRAKAEGK